MFYLFGALCGPRLSTSEAASRPAQRRRSTCCTGGWPRVVYGPPLGPFEGLLFCIVSWTPARAGNSRRASYIYIYIYIHIIIYIYIYIYIYIHTYAGGCCSDTPGARRRGDWSLASRRGRDNRGFTEGSHFPTSFNILLSVRTCCHICWSYFVTFCNLIL